MAINLPIIVLLCLLAFGQATQKNTLDALRKWTDVIFESNILVQSDNITPLYCIYLCMRNIDCMSYVYADGTGRCVQYRTVFHTKEGSTSLSGTAYYVVGVQAVCPISKQFLHFRMRNTCHKFVTHHGLGYRQAQNACRGFGGHLSDFYNPEERDDLKNTMRWSPGYTKGCFHVGVHRDGPAGKRWVWRDGTDAIRPGFWLEKPKGHGDCVEFCRDSGFNDKKCTKTKYICEIDIK